MKARELVERARNSKYQNYTIAFVLFSITFVIYLFTAPKTVALEDDGLFILACHFLGISHAPGYPLHVLLGNFFSSIPVGSVAYRIHLLSSVFAALTCVYLWLSISLIIKNKSCAFIAALAYGFSKVFWSQAIIAEVYTLNTFFFFLLLYMTLRIANEENPTKQSAVGFISIAFVYGLSLTNHWPLMILSTPTLLIIGFRKWKKAFRTLPGMSVAFGLGLTPYLWMFFHAQQNPLKILVHPISNFTEFFAYVSRKVVAQADSSISAGWADKLQFAHNFHTEAASQFTTVLFLIILTGFVIQFRTLSKPIVIALIIGFAANSYGLIVLLNFDFDRLFASVFRVYPLIAYGIMSIWLALGIQFLSTYLKKAYLKGLDTALIKTSVSVLLILLPLLTHLSLNNRSNYRWAEDYAHTLLNSLEKNAVLFVQSDTDVGPIGYARYIQGIRPDVSIYSNAYPDFIHPLFYPYKKSRQYSTVNEILSTTSRPVFYIETLNHPYGNRYLWLYSKALRDSNNMELISLTPNMMAYLDRIIIQDQHLDVWTVFHRNLLFTRIIPLLVHQLYSDKFDNPQYKKYLEFATKHVEGKIQMIVQSQQYTKNPEKLHKLLDTAQGMIDTSMTKQNKSMYFLLKGDLFLSENAIESATKMYHLSLDSWSHTKNPALIRLLNLYEENKEASKRDQLLQRFSEYLEISTIPESSGIHP